MKSSQTSEPSAETRRPRVKFRLVASIVVVITLAVLAGMIPRLRQRAALAVETQNLAMTRVAVVSAAPDTIGADLLLPAEIEPWIESPIYARASGYLKSWLVDIGTPVKKGQLLAVIETPDLDQELDQTRHQLAEAEASLSLARITAARYAELVKSASVSEQDNAEKQADLALQTANVAAAQAAVRRLEYLESFSRVTAPFTGTITARNCDVGELITAGNTKELFRLSQTDKLRVYVNVPQSDAAGVVAGQTAELLVHELPGRQFTAKVVRSAGQISSDSRTLLTELEVDNKNNEILAGSFEQVKFAVSKPQNTLTLPTGSVIFGAEGPHVAVVLTNDRIEMRSVRLGRNYGQVIEILAGVEPHQRVVLNPPESLMPGTVVSVVESKQNQKGGPK